MLGLNSAMPFSRQTLLYRFQKLSIECTLSTGAPAASRAAALYGVITGANLSDMGRSAAGTSWAAPWGQRGNCTVGPPTPSGLQLLLCDCFRVKRQNLLLFSFQFSANLSLPQNLFGKLRLLLQRIDGRSRLKPSGTRCIRLERYLDGQVNQLLALDTPRLGHLPLELLKMHKNRFFLVLQLPVGSKHVSYVDSICSNLLRWSHSR